jgi:dephospho-CoA kinase
VLRVGLTGGIAGGKTTVAELFRDLGAAIIDTDVIARDVVRPGSSALDEIHRQFGADIINSDGTLDRARLRGLIFADDAKKQALEGILHPRIQAETERLAGTVGGPYQLIVVPLLVESPLNELMDRILVVDCDPDTQLARLLERDVGGEEQARRMIAAQASREERLAIADDLIDNSGSFDATWDQVATLHDYYLELTQSSS